MKTFVLLLLIFSSTSWSQITKPELDETIQALELAYKDELKNQNIDLTINFELPTMRDFWWNLNDPMASFVELPKNDQGVRQFNIYVLGGLARYKGMSKEGIALFLCHELAHGIGGSPRKVSGFTVEGQADYFATSECIHKLLPYFTTTGFNLNDEERALCLKVKDQMSCERVVGGIKSYGKVLEYTRGEALSLFKKAPEVAQKTDLSDTYYPTPQCRLNTLVAGLLKQSRPVCWFAGP